MPTDAPATKGRVMRSHARYYDLLAWVLTLGRERALRERLAALAQVAPGEAVLDVGCGTGTLAIAAKRRAGAEGRVHGIDASPEMIERARAKAARAGVDVTFDVAVVERLPFPDGHFDVVLSTLMLHHLPRAVREEAAREMKRVLKPGGRVLAVDFATPARERKGIFARLHRHGHMKLDDMVAVLQGAGLRADCSGAVGVSDLHYVTASAAPATDHPGADAHVAAPVTRSLPPLPAPRWVWALGLLALAGVHGLLVLGGMRSGAAADTGGMLTLLLLVVVVLLLTLHGRHGVHHRR